MHRKVLRTSLELINLTPASRQAASVERAVRAGKHGLTGRSLSFSCMGQNLLQWLFNTWRYPTTEVTPSKLMTPTLLRCSQPIFSFLIARSKTKWTMWQRNDHHSSKWWINTPTCKLISCHVALLGLRKKRNRYIPLDGVFPFSQDTHTPFHY